MLPLVTPIKPKEPKGASLLPNKFLPSHVMYTTMQQKVVERDLLLFPLLRSLEQEWLSKSQCKSTNRYDGICDAREHIQGCGKRCIYMYIYIYIYTHITTYGDRCTCKHTYIHLYMDIQIYVYTCVCLYTHVCVYIYIYIYIYKNFAYIKIHVYMYA